MRRSIEAVELGATLFVPATHKDLLSLACGNKYPELKSMLIDTEDAISHDKFPHAKKNVLEFLQEYERGDVFVFLRPRDVETLKEFLACGNIEKIDGFILPKFSLENAKEYLEVLQNTDFYIMPSIETQELFEHSQLLQLRDIILEKKEKVLLVRFGLEDMLRQLGLRRKCEESVFDLCACSFVLGNFISVFKSSGFSVSGGVYPCFKDDEGFVKDLQRDLKEGLFSKTIIHPNQIKIANELYKVTQKELDEALELSHSKEAIFSQNSKMAESSTMLPWAKEIIKRSKIYGIK